MMTEAQNETRRKDDARPAGKLEWNEADPRAAGMGDLMIDIESLGTTPGAAILSIGAVQFGADGLGAEFYAPILLGSCTAAGLTIDPGTIAWWMKQSDAARAAAFRDDAEALAVVLYRFTTWFNEHGAERPWCHGATFDVLLLDAAYKACGMTPPWKYWTVRDTRTLYEQAGVKVDRALGVHHNALDDAKAQAEAAVTALEVLRDRRAAAQAAPAQPHAIEIPPMGIRATLDALSEKHLDALIKKYLGPTLAAPAAPEQVQAFPERDASKPAEQQGIFHKFDIRRVDGSDQPGGKHHGCRYFVLDLTHDQHAPAAMRAYASACRATHPQLAVDIEAEFGAPPSAAQVQAIPAGYKMVPVEPTVEMRNACYEEYHKAGATYTSMCRAIIAAAPGAAAPAAPSDSTPLADLWMHEDMARDQTDAIVNSKRKDLQAAYIGAREDLAIWKRRALEAEAKLRAAPAAPEHDEVRNQALEDAAALLDRKYTRKFAAPWAEEIRAMKTSTNEGEARDE